MNELSLVLMRNLFNAYADFYEACLDYLEDMRTQNEPQR